MHTDAHRYGLSVSIGVHLWPKIPLFIRVHSRLEYDACPAQPVSPPPLRTHLRGMTLERYLRMIGGFLVLLSVALGAWVDPRWLYFTAFVGLNLFQSAFTNWCPMVAILKWLGVSPCVAQRANETVQRTVA